MNQVARWILLLLCVGCGTSAEHGGNSVAGSAGSSDLNAASGASGAGEAGRHSGAGGAGSAGEAGNAGDTGGRSGAGGAGDAGDAGNAGRHSGAGGAGDAGEAGDIGGRSGAGGAGSAGDAGGVGGHSGAGEAGEAGNAGDTGGRSGAGGAGGVAQGGTASGGVAGGPDVTLPPANAPFDYQIGEPYTPPAGVTVISRDRESAPYPGIYNICYVNGYQTQPNEKDFWLGTHAELILTDAEGNLVVDPDWNEYLVDTSTQAKRTALADIVGEWIEQCAASGFDAVEIDNLDSYSRSDGLLTEDNNVDYMAALSAIAHRAGLAIAQKNSAELLPRVADMGTDFVVAEQCNRWNECADYQDVYGDRVYVIEYRQQDFDAGCIDFPELSIVLRDRDVTAPGSASYVYEGR